MMFNIVLVEPEIPQNAGNIARTCAATGTRLHMIRPLGFEVTDKYLKRAGLDYWYLVDVFYYDSFEQLRAQNPNARFFYFTTKARNKHSDVQFRDGDFLVFGKETKGLPEELLMENEEFCLRIPMFEKARSLNLSNSAAIALYEALRQNDYPDLLEEGELHEHKWSDKKV
ncbi:MAG: tRNA (uridine(34)/cytosine(34)/5-carboxymethylaminomethyluridine(34)-2'-O)-methyltransferase TrmL [Clostridia bacterium]|nr:tRNA (uridine(34)/cytosine(34)/5-carboxymethylaminomethyluridine(34)-2'-O)-methyltransferase TrmL [Clostridia bacterium]